jgi:hypothetical protein
MFCAPVARPGALRNAEVSSHHRRSGSPRQPQLGSRSPLPRPAKADGLSGLGDELCLDPLGTPAKEASQETIGRPLRAELKAQPLLRHLSHIPQQALGASPHSRKVTSPSGRFHDGLLLHLLHGELTESW